MIDKNRLKIKLWCYGGNANIRTRRKLSVGDGDILTPLKYSKIIHQNILNSELKTIENACHFSNMVN